MRGHRLSLGLAALAIIAAACGGGAQSPAEDATTPTAADTSTSASPPSAPSTHGAASGEPVQQLFAFQAPRVNDGTYDATQLSGRDVAIWFWAPW